MQRNSKKLLALPVVSLEDGRQVGKVRGLVIEPASRTVAALLLDQRGWFQEPKVVAFSRVRSIGEHAVTVDSGDAVERAGNLPSLARSLKEPTPLIGARVITEDGNDLGVVEEFSFDTASGSIAYLELNTGLFKNLWKGKALLKASLLVTIGKTALIARREAEGQLVREEGTLEGTMKSVRGTSSKVLDSTVKTTRQWGENLTRSIEKILPEGLKDKTKEEDPPPPSS